MRCTVWLLLILLASVAGGQEVKPYNPGESVGPLDFLNEKRIDLEIEDPAKPVKFRKLWATYNYAQDAWTDIQTVPLEHQPFQRYVTMPDTSREYYGMFCVALNMAMGYNPLNYRPARVADGRLMRIDLRQLASDPDDQKHVIATYEKLAKLDWYYHTRVIQKTPRTVSKVINIQPFRDPKTGQTISTKTVEETVFDEVEIAKPSQHAGLVTMESLHAAVASEAAILHGPWLLRMIISVNDGGLYYEFRGVEDSDANKTAETKWLELMGADQNLVRNLKAEQRIGMWRSKVTGQPRAVEFFYAPGTRPDVGPSSVTISRDFFEGQINKKKHPMKNLLNYKQDGSETIGILPNGMPLYGAFDAKGDLIRLVPQELVTDRRVPEPHPANLQAAISCIRCHAEDDNYVPAFNQVGWLTGRGLQLFDDESSAESPEETLSRLKGMYAGNMDELMRISRTTVSRAAFTTSGGMEFKDIAVRMSVAFDDYYYGPVTAAVALRDLGYEVAPEDAAKLFNRVVPMLPPNKFGIRPESFLVDTLRNWNPDDPIRKDFAINRVDWEQEFQDVMLRVITEEIRTQKGEPAVDAVPVEAVEKLVAPDGNK